MLWGDCWKQELAAYRLHTTLPARPSFRHWVLLCAICLHWLKLLFNSNHRHRGCSWCWCITFGSCGWRPSVEENAWNPRRIFFASQFDAREEHECAFRPQLTSVISDHAKEWEDLVACIAAASCEVKDGSAAVNMQAFGKVRDSLTQRFRT